MPQQIQQPPAEKIAGAGGIPSGEAFGTPTVTRTLTATRLTLLGIVFALALTVGFGVAGVVASELGWLRALGLGIVATVITLMGVASALRSRRIHERLDSLAAWLWPV